MASSDWAKNLKCTDLRNICRAMQIKGSGRMSKEQMISVCDYRRYLIQKKAGHEVDIDKLSAQEQSKFLMSYKDAVIGKEPKVGPNPSESDIIRVMWKNQAKHVSAVLNKKYADAKCDPSKGESNPVWDLERPYGTANDCPPGHFRNAKGCCVSIKDHLGIMSGEELQQICEGCAPDTSPEDMRKMVEAQQAATEELYRYINLQKFKTKQELDMILSLAKRIQEETKLELQKRLENLRALFMSEEDCEGKPFNKTTEADTRARNRIWHMAFAPIKFAAGKVSTVAGAAAAKGKQATVSFAVWMADLIVRHPGYAKLVIFLLVGVKDQACKYVLSWIYKKPDEATSAMAQAFKAAKSVARGVDAHSMFIVDFVSNKLVLEMVPKALKGSVSLVGGVVAGFVSANPFVGTAVAGIITNVTGSVGDALADAAERVIAANQYKTDLIDCLKFTFRFFDFEECFIEGFGEKHWATIFVAQTKIKLGIPTKLSKGKLETLVGQAEEKANAVLEAASNGISSFASTIKGGIMSAVGVPVGAASARSRRPNKEKSLKSRPSPSRHAAQTPIGKRMKGNDGNMWVVREDKNGRHYWRRV